jgi:type VI protein secretion system component Hcp
MLTSSVVIIGNESQPLTPAAAPFATGPENSVPILNFTFGASINGRTAAKGPFLVYREVDSVSPLLLSTLVSSTSLSEVKIVAVLNKTSGAGFFYSLQKAKITALDTFAVQSSAPNGSDGTLLERIQFGFNGLATYYFDGKDTKLSQWGYQPKTNKTSDKEKEKVKEKEKEPERRFGPLGILDAITDYFGLS